MIIYSFCFMIAFAVVPVCVDWLGFRGRVELFMIGGCWAFLGGLYGVIPWTLYYLTWGGVASRVMVCGWVITRFFGLNCP
jgi:hypothetical protein